MTAWTWVWARTWAGVPAWTLEASSPVELLPGNADDCWQRRSNVAERSIG